MYPTGREREFVVHVVAGQVSEIRLDSLDIRLESFGVISDVLPSNDVFYRPAVIRPEHAVSVRPDFPHSAYEGSECTEVMIDLSTADYNGIFWLPDGEDGSAPGADVTAVLQPSRDEGVILEGWIRGDASAKVELKVGGMTSGPYHDSMPFAVTTGYIPLTPDWRRFEIDLTGEDLSSVIRGFCLVADKRHNPRADRVNAYLDEVKFSRVIK